MNEREREAYDKEHRVIYDDMVAEIDTLYDAYKKKHVPGMRDDSISKATRVITDKYNRRLVELKLKYGVEITSTGRKYLPPEYEDQEPT